MLGSGWLPLGQTKGHGVVQGHGCSAKGRGTCHTPTKLSTKPREVGGTQEPAEDSVHHLAKECYMQDHALFNFLNICRADTVIKDSLFCF